MKKNKLGIVGAGALGSEIFELASEGLLVDNYKKRKFGKIFFVDPINRSMTKYNSDREYLENEGKANYIIAVASPREREKISDYYESSGARAITIISKSAHVSKSSKLGIGAVIQKYSSISCNTVAGKFLILNFNSYVGHDCQIGNYVTISPGVSIGGNVHIEDSVFIGSGATIKNGTDQKPIRIGKCAVIGMGAVVISDVPAHSVVVGNPAKIVTK